MDLAQVKVSLSLQIKNAIQHRASELGLSIPNFIKFVLIQELKDDLSTPIFLASDDTLADHQAATKESKGGKTKKINGKKDLDSYFKKLAQEI